MDDLWYWDTKGRVWEEMHPFTDHPCENGSYRRQHEERPGHGATNLRRRRRLLKQQEVAERVRSVVQHLERFDFGDQPRCAVVYLGRCQRHSGKIGGKNGEIDIDVDRSGDLFAIDGPQEVKLQTHHQCLTWFSDPPPIQTTLCFCGAACLRRAFAVCVWIRNGHQKIEVGKNVKIEISILFKSISATQTFVRSCIDLSTSSL